MSNNSPIVVTTSTGGGGDGAFSLRTIVLVSLLLAIVGVVAITAYGTWLSYQFDNTSPNNLTIKQSLDLAYLASSTLSKYLVIDAGGNVLPGLPASSVPSFAPNGTLGVQSIQCYDFTSFVVNLPNIPPNSLLGTDGTNHLSVFPSAGSSSVSVPNSLVKTDGNGNLVFGNTTINPLTVGGVKYPSVPGTKGQVLTLVDQISAAWMNLNVTSPTVAVLNSLLAVNTVLGVTSASSPSVTGIPISTISGAVNSLVQTDASGAVALLTLILGVLTVSGNATFSSTLVSNGHTYLNAGLDVTGPTIHNGGITQVSGSTSLQATTVGNGLTVGNGITVASGTTSLLATNVANGLTVSNGTTTTLATNINGPATLSAGLAVASGSSSSFTGVVDIQAQLTTHAVINAMGSIKIGSQKVDIWGSDVNGNLVPSTVTFASLNNTGGTINQAQSTNIPGDFNISGTLKVGLLKPSAGFTPGTAYDILGLSITGAIVPGTATTVPTPNAISRYGANSQLNSVSSLITGSTSGYGLVIDTLNSQSTLSRLSFLDQTGIRISNLQGPASDVIIGIDFATFSSFSDVHVSSRIVAWNNGNYGHDLIFMTSQGDGINPRERLRITGSDGNVHVVSVLFASGIQITGLAGQPVRDILGFDAFGNLLPGTATATPTQNAIVRFGADSSLSASSFSTNAPFATSAFAGPVQCKTITSTGSAVNAFAGPISTTIVTSTGSGTNSFTGPISCDSITTTGVASNSFTGPLQALTLSSSGSALNIFSGPILTSTVTSTGNSINAFTGPIRTTIVTATGSGLNNFTGPIQTTLVTSTGSGNNHFSGTVIVDGAFTASGNVFPFAVCGTQGQTIASTGGGILACSSSINAPGTVSSLGAGTNAFTGSVSSGGGVTAVGDITSSTGAVASKTTLTSGADLVVTTKLSSYNATITAGLGIPIMVKHILVHTANFIGLNNFCVYRTKSTNEALQINGFIDMSEASGGSNSMSLTYTNPNGQAKGGNMQGIVFSCCTGQSVSFGDQLSLYPIVIYAAPGTDVVVATTGSSTGFYTANCQILRLA